MVDSDFSEQEKAKNNKRQREVLSKDFMWFSFLENTNKYFVEKIRKQKASEKNFRGFF